MALYLALVACKVKAGDKVLIPAYSCSAIRNSILFTGAEPIACDINYDDANIDASDGARLASKHNITVAIAVNTFGYPSNIKVLQDAGLKVIEDCSHGFDLDHALRPKVKGDVLVQSLYATKLFGSTELGVILLNDTNEAAHLRDMRDGYSLRTAPAGLNMKATEFSGALGALRYGNANEILKRRAEIASNYLSDPLLAGITVGNHPSRTWYRYLISATNAGKLMRFLSGKVEAVRPLTPWPLELEKFPSTARAYQDFVSLPLYPSLTGTEQRRTIDLIKKFYEKHSQ
jgi:perosamine synthetase